ncbi:MAG: hypothetical protein ABSF12_06470 [Bryobacteraceae bacterium]|jgi:predicted nucleic acid-binding protein
MTLLHHSRKAGRVVTIATFFDTDADYKTDQAKLSFWDALVVVAAARAGTGVLYTEDLNDGQEILGVRVVNPFRV